MSYTVDDLRRELGSLYIEVRMRIEAEEKLKERIIELESELKGLRPVALKGE